MILQSTHLNCRTHIKTNKIKVKKKMERIGKIFVTALCCVMAAVSFNSCMDSEDYSIDEQTYKKYMNDMAGEYGGRVRFYYPKYNGIGLEATKYDSTDTYWTARADSTVTLYRFPISKLDSAIIVPSTDNTVKGKYLRELHNQMRSMPDVTLKSFFYIASKQAITSQYVQFYVNPAYVETTFNYEGSPKKAYFLFYPNYLSGIWTATKHTFEYQMALYAICFDKPEINAETTATTYTYMREIYITCEAK